MTWEEALQRLGLKGFRVISDSTTVVESADGMSVRPATQLEQRMYTLIRSLTE